MITLKGTKEGITILAEHCGSLQEAREELTEKLSAANGFFDGVTVPVLLKADDFSEFETYLLRLAVQKLLPEADVRFEENDAEDRRQEIVHENVYEEVQKEVLCAKQDMLQDVFYKGTVRSGQALSAPGHLIVLGDANPGSELVAGGNIVVMGAARGMLWAGAQGDRGAVISAARLLPSQIRIADMICRKPDDELPPTGFYPEFAEIRCGHIYIERKLQKIV